MKKIRAFSGAFAVLLLGLGTFLSAGPVVPEEDLVLLGEKDEMKRAAVIKGIAEISVEMERNKKAQDNRSKFFDGAKTEDSGAVKAEPLPGAKDQLPNLPDFKKAKPEKPAVPGKIDGNLFKKIGRAVSDIEWNSPAGASIAAAVGAGLGYFALSGPLGLLALLVGAAAGLIYWALYRD